MAWQTWGPLFLHTGNLAVLTGKPAAWGRLFLAPRCQRAPIWGPIILNAIILNESD